MRNLYAEQLQSIDEGLVDMARHVQQAVNRATHSLLTADTHVADQVIAGDAQIDLFRDRIEDRVFEVLALQQPVAGDLRMLMGAIRMIADLERMRDLDAVAQLERDDEEMDQLRRQSFRVLLGDTWPHGVEPAIDIALVGRYYERIADHAVTLARRVVYLVTGESSRSRP